MATVANEMTPMLSDSIRNLSLANSLDYLERQRLLEENNRIKRKRRNKIGKYTCGSLFVISFSILIVLLFINGYNHNFSKVMSMVSMMFLVLMICSCAFFDQYVKNET